MELFYIQLSSETEVRAREKGCSKPLGARTNVCFTAQAPSQTSSTRHDGQDYPYPMPETQSKNMLKYGANNITVQSHLGGIPMLGRILREADAGMFCETF